MSALAEEYPDLIGDPRTLRRGRHRNKALAAWRRNCAVQMAAKGHTYQAIADTLGYASRGSVYRIVHDSLAESAVAGVEELRSTELKELRRLRLALAPKIAAGHPPSVMAALAVTDRIWRLLGLVDDPRKIDPRAGWDSCQGPPTVVVRADDCRHNGCPVHGRFDQG